MKKTFSIMAVVAGIIILPGVVLAQQNQQGAQAQDRIQDPVAHQEVAAPQGNQVQNRVITQNAGEESQFKVNTQESLQNNEEVLTMQARGGSVKENMGEVAQKVQQLLSDEEPNTGIGPKVREIAQQQAEAQGKIEDEVSKIESRQGLTKKLFGTDYKAVKNLKQQVEQNQVRVQSLQELQNQTTNQAEETQIQELTQVLLSQNEALEEQIQAEEKVGSIFGWLIKLFN